MVSAITQASAGVATPTSSVTINREPVRGESSFLYTHPKTTTPGLRKYRAWCFDVNDEDICLGLLGQGTTFCTVKNCKKTHRSNVYHVALPGELYVARTADTAFVDPVVKTSVLREDLLERWEEMSCTLDENLSILI